MGNIKASICLATYNKPQYLRKVLESIYRQSPPFEFEVCIIDDGSATTETMGICSCYPVRYFRIDREPGFRNPSIARNIAYKMARGEIIIAQSDDVLHITENTIERLVDDLMPGSFLISNVFNVDDNGFIIPHNRDNPSYNPLTIYAGPTNRRPFFFLGSLYRKDLYAIGGNDEDFVSPGYDDDWFADCLIRGLKLNPIFTSEIIGHHLHHIHFATQGNVLPSYLLYKKKYEMASRNEIPWCASGGPWPNN